MRNSPFALARIPISGVGAVPDAPPRWHRKPEFHLPREPDLGAGQTPPHRSPASVVLIDPGLDLCYDLGYNARSRVQRRTGQRRPDAISMNSNHDRRLVIRFVNVGGAAAL